MSPSRSGIDKWHGRRHARACAGILALAAALTGSAAASRAAEAEPFVDDVHDDIGITLIQIHSEMLNKVDTAIRQLEQGTYGQCTDCGNAIAPQRLRALPFAVRCLSCQSSRESTRPILHVTPLSRFNEFD